MDNLGHSLLSFECLQYQGQSSRFATFRTEIARQDTKYFLYLTFALNMYFIKVSLILHRIQPH